MKPALLSVGEVSRRSGVAVSALHFYEAEGLLQSQRSAGNQRRYTRDVLRRIAFIRAAQQLGVGLKEVAQELQLLPKQRTPNKADWARLSAHWRTALDQRIAELIALRDRLHSCIGCGCLSLKACRLYNPEDRLAERGPGAHRLRSESSG